MKRLLGVAGAVAAILIAGHALKLVWDAGLFTELPYHSERECRSVEGIQGAEDIELVDGLAFITSNHHAPAFGVDAPPGDLLVWDVEAGESAPRSIRPRLDFDFRPHGLAAVRDKDRVRLLVVNHRRDGDRIEEFHWTPKAESADWIRGYADSRFLYNANDVAILSSEEFLVTHDHGARSHWGKLVENFSRWGRGFISRFDGQVFRVASEGLHFANGIVRDPLTGHFFVAAMLERKIFEFSLDDPGRMRRIREISLEAGPDNLFLDPTRREVWIGAHPKIFALKAHSENPRDVKAPALVLKLDLRDPAARAVPVFSDDGRRISAVSVAVRSGQRVLLGSIYDTKILDCRWPESSVAGEK